MLLYDIFCPEGISRNRNIGSGIIVHAAANDCKYLNLYVMADMEIDVCKQNKIS